MAVSAQSRDGSSQGQLVNFEETPPRKPSGRIRYPEKRRSADRDQRLYNQVYHLPRQLERARARVRQLEAQAIRLGLRDLVETAQ